MNTNTKTISTPFAIILTAILLVVSCVASLIAVSIFDNSSAKNTQDTLANAQNVLTEYNTSYSGMYFEFTNDVYLKTDYIAKAYTDKSQLESMAKAFSLDSVKVTDLRKVKLLPLIPIRTQAKTSPTTNKPPSLKRF